MDIRKFQLDSNHNILSCKVPSKIKIQILLFNGPSFCGTDKAVLKIIIRDNKRKKNGCLDKPVMTIILNYY